MRRTSLMVLVLALAFALLAVSVPPSLAQTASARVTKRHTHSAASRASKSSGSRAARASTPRAKASRASARRTASHRPAAPAPHAAPYRTSRRGRASAYRTRHLSGTTTIALPRRNRPSAPLSLPRAQPSVSAQAAALTATGAATQVAAFSRPMPLSSSLSVPMSAPLPGRMPPPMRGSLLSLERQNAMADAEGLERILDEADLSDRIAHGLLVPVPASAELAVNAELPDHHRYCRPWTARFLSDLAAAHYAQFHRPLQVSSAVRTVEYQKRLMQVNGNAAPAEGDVVSPHLTGATIDIAKDNLSRAEMAWMRRYLLAREAEGKIDVEEEFQQSCFHIAVYKNYLPAYHPAPSLPSQAHTGRPKHRPVPTQAVDEAPAQGF